MNGTTPIRTGDQTNYYMCSSGGYENLSSTTWDNYIDDLAAKMRIPKFYLSNLKFEQKEPDMKIFTWNLISAFEEGKTPVKSGTVSAKTEASAREFIVRTFREEDFDSYRIGDYVLILKEMGSW